MARKKIIVYTLDRPGLVNHKMSEMKALFHTHAIYGGAQDESNRQPMKDIQQE